MSEPENDLHPMGSGVRRSPEWAAVGNWDFLDARQSLEYEIRPQRIPYFIVILSRKSDAALITGAHIPLWPSDIAFGWSVLCTVKYISYRQTHLLPPSTRSLALAIIVWATPWYWGDRIIYVTRCNYALYTFLLTRNYLSNKSCHIRQFISSSLVYSPRTATLINNPSGNAWAALGMLRVSTTITKSKFASQMTQQVTDLNSWTKQILDGTFAALVSFSYLERYGLFKKTTCFQDL